MTILFAGGELEDFTLGGSVTFSTSGSVKMRAAYARGYAIVAAASTNMAASIKAAFTASSAFSATARFYQNNNTAASRTLCWFATGGSARLRLTCSGSSPTTIILESYTSGGVAATLATSSLTFAADVLHRLDVTVDYQAAGRVRVWINGTLYIDFSGNPIVSSATTLDGFYMSTCSQSFDCNWSEVIVATQDTRTLSLVTLAPNAAGSANAWTGAYTDVDETTASDIDVMTSATANQVANLNTTGMPTGWSNLTVTAVKVTASAARGSTGPSKLALGVRTNTTDSFPTATTLDTGFSTPVTTYYELNPVTSAAWTTTEIDALQIALKSET